jgi:uncharacterized protein YbjT (DUF2867 family)
MKRKASAMTVLVYGSTGSQGGPVARALLEQGGAVRVLVRDPARAAELAAAGAEVVTGDLVDVASLAAANVGVDAAFVVISASVPPREYVLHARNALTAARDARVPHVVVSTSGIVTDDDADVAILKAKQDLLRLVADLTPHAVVLEPTIYLDNFAYVYRPAIEQGVIPQPLPADVPVAYVSLDDAAAYTVAALDRPDLAGRRLSITGPEALTGHELAERFARHLGRPVHYVAADPAEFARQVEPFLGAEIADALAQMYAYEGGPAARHLAPDTAATRAALPIEQPGVDAWIAKNF